LICAAFCLSCDILSASCTTLLPGRLRLAPAASTKLRRTRLPAWCVAARCVGTRYRSVEMPSATWRRLMWSDALMSRYVVGGSWARMCGRRANANSETTERNVV